MSISVLTAQLFRKIKNLSVGKNTLKNRGDGRKALIFLY
jgi:hypothetical protein